MSDRLIKEVLRVEMDLTLNIQESHSFGFKRTIVLDVGIVGNDLQDERSRGLVLPRCSVCRYILS